MQPAIPSGCWSRSLFGYTAVSAENAAAALAGAQCAVHLGYTQGASPHAENASAPASGFLGKPFRRANLVRKVREVLDTPPV